jgi:hypothetical protein
VRNILSAEHLIPGFKRLAILHSDRERIEQQGKPREVAVALTARAALRVLPVVQEARGVKEYASLLVLPVFRATSGAWAVARFSGREKELAAAAHDAAATAGNVALYTTISFVSRADVASRATVRSAAFATAVASGVGDPYGTSRNALDYCVRAIGYSDAIARPWQRCLRY